MDECRPVLRPGHWVQSSGAGRVPRVSYKKIMVKLQLEWQRMACKLPSTFVLYVRVMLVAPTRHAKFMTLLAGSIRSMTTPRLINSQAVVSCHAPFINSLKSHQGKFK
jgi:hypothetical protein